MCRHHCRMTSPAVAPGSGRTLASAARWRSSTARMTSTQRPSRPPKWWISIRWLVPIAAASSRRLRSLTPRDAMCSIADSSSRPFGSLPAIAQKCTVWYIMTPPQPVTVSVDVPQPRAAVYDYLDVMANHEAFTDHMLVNWRVSGPATGIGSKANVTSKVGGLSDEAEIEVFEIDPGRMIRERSIAAKGKRIAHGTYTLSDLPGGGTRIEFEFALQKVPAIERPFVPLMRKLVRSGNEKAMQRLAALLDDQAKLAA